MAACALVATADGEVSFTERVRVDQIVQTLEELKAFDPLEAADLFRDYCDLILGSPKDGHPAVVKDLEAVAGNTETAELLIRICLAVSEVNGETSLVDQIEVVTLCSLLELDPSYFGLYKDTLLKELSA